MINPNSLLRVQPLWELFTRLPSESHCFQWQQSHHEAIKEQSVSIGWCVSVPPASSREYPLSPRGSGRTKQSHADLFPRSLRLPLLAKLKVEAIIANHPTTASPPSRILSVLNTWTHYCNYLINLIPSFRTAPSINGPGIIAPWHLFFLWNLQMLSIQWVTMYDQQLRLFFCLLSVLLLFIHLDCQWVTSGDIRCQLPLEHNFLNCSQLGKIDN